MVDVFDQVEEELRSDRYKRLARTWLPVVGGVLLVLRRRVTGRPGRRPAALLVDAFGLALIMLALLYIAGITGSPLFEITRQITFAALGLAPVAFLIALLDARLARTDVGALLVELPCSGASASSRASRASWTPSTPATPSGVRALSSRPASTHRRRVSSLTPSKAAASDIR